MENCETSAWGRALAALGIGIDVSIASSNEVSMAIAKQSTTPNNKTTQTSTTAKKKLTDEIKGKMIQAVKNGNRDAVENAIGGYDISEDIKKEILA